MDVVTLAALIVGAAAGGAVWTGLARRGTHSGVIFGVSWFVAMLIYALAPVLFSSAT